MEEGWKRRNLKNSTTCIISVYYTENKELLLPKELLPLKRPTHIVGCPPRFQCEIPLQMWSKGPFKVTDKTCHSIEFFISHQRSYGFQILREKEKCGIRSWQVQSSFFYPKAFLIPNSRDIICPHSFSYKNTWNQRPCSCGNMHLCRCMKTKFRSFRKIGISVQTSVVFSFCI